MSIKEKQAQKFPHQIPIVLGVTGHRDLRKEDIPLLEAKVREIFLDIKTKYPDSPITLLSPLAEGADRLVARVSLDFGASLIVPIPMPIEEYKKDFHDEISCVEFQSLLDRADHQFELPLVEGNTILSIAQDGDSRNHQYAQIGNFIAQHSQILIALWDGVETNLEGGTFYIRKNKLEGNFTHSAPNSKLYQAESGPVIHIVTPRQKNPHPTGESFSIKKEYPGYWKDKIHAEEIYGRTLQNVNRFNQDLKSYTELIPTESAKNRDLVIPDTVIKGINGKEQEIFDRFVLTDALASMFKGYRVKSILGLLTLIVVAFLFFHLYLGLVQKPIMLMMYPLLLTGGLLWYFFAKRQGYEYKHEDYRALAEATRIQFFWRLIGICDNVADHYLRIHKGELEWIRYALRVWNLPTEPCEFVKYKDFDNHSNNYDVTLIHWVEKQKNWFRKRGEEDFLKLRKLEKLGNHFFSFGFSIALLLLILEIFRPNFLMVLGINFEFTRHICIVMVALPLAIAAAIHGFADKMVLTEQSKQYSSMADLYGNAHTKLESFLKDKDFVNAKELVFELGKEALVENGNWLTLHRSRPLEMPKG